jgi:8-oxo-dGTP pyrophosphatase MutT (NUDIX family)
MEKKKRGTAIVKTEQGILLTKTRSGLFLLPGGHTKKGEPRIIAAIRELKEETNLSSDYVEFLFEYDSSFYAHKVFYIKSTGIPKALNEIEQLGYYPGIRRDHISRSSIEIIQRFLSLERI